MYSKCQKMALLWNKHKLFTFLLPPAAGTTFLAGFAKASRLLFWSIFHFMVPTRCSCEGFDLSEMFSIFSVARGKIWVGERRQSHVRGLTPTRTPNIYLWFRHVKTKIFRSSFSNYFFSNSRNSKTFRQFFF